MRIAAGIMMIIGAIIEFTMVMVMTTPQKLIWPSFGAMLVAIFVIVGGICTLKRRAWKVSLTSSILTLPTGFLSTSSILLTTIGFTGLSPAEIMQIFSFWIIPSFLLGLLPIIFVRRRKREWKKAERSSSAPMKVSLQTQDVEIKRDENWPEY
ncbi:MAG: hypothetical protein HY673_13890 [Chloroflexi bacterium]|nr:hypothetical protein [Chloroflexota bacterium]